MATIIAGIPHTAVKSAFAGLPHEPKARQKMLTVRVSPIKRMVASAPKIKEDKPSNIKF